MPVELLDLSTIRNSFKIQRRTPRIKDHRQLVIRYDIDVVVSGLQKFIRRGNIKSALLFAYILFRMKGVFRKKLVDRLLVISSEDIGISSVSVAPFLMKVFGEKVVFGERKRDIDVNEREIFTSICLMCVSKKDRSVDHAIYPMITRVGKKDIPEETSVTDIYELKKEFYFSLVNKLEKRAVYFVGQLYFGKGKYESEFFSDENTGHSIFAAWDEMRKYYDQVVKDKDKDSVILRNFESLVSIFRYFFKEKFGPRPELLHLVHAVIMLVNHDLVIEKSENKGEIKILDQEEINIAKEKMELLKEVDDYVMDKHTKVGREMGRYFKHFIEIGSHLENRIDWKEDIYFRNFKKFLLMDERMKHGRKSKY